MQERRSFLASLGLVGGALMAPSAAQGGIFRRCHPASPPATPCVPIILPATSREVKFGRNTLELVQGNVTLISITHMVSTTAETQGSPGLIKFMPYWSGAAAEVGPGFKFVCAPVYFDVDFPVLGKIYYKWVDFTYRYKAGSVNEIRHSYIDVEGFWVA